MNVILMVFYLAVALGALVFIHEGGHFLAARAFGCLLYTSDAADD